MNAYLYRNEIICNIVDLSCAALVAAYRLGFKIQMLVKYHLDVAKLKSIYE